MKKLIFCITAVLTACSGEVKNTTATEEPKPVADTTACTATLTNDTILGDSTLIFPEIILPDTAIAEKINKRLTVQMISYYTIDELKEYKENFKKDSILFGLTAAGYEITYNENCLLSLTINMETMGAYPSGYSVYRNFDINTGDSISLEKMLDETKINDLIKLCDDTLQNRIERCRKEYADQDFIVEQLTGQQFTRKNLVNFYVTQTHVVLVYNFGFPHVIQGTEPDGFIKIARKDFRKYLKVNPYKI
ncbi:MAG: hypothetical protein ACXVC6_06660 [Bacteroidia bacterium]